MKTTNQLLRRCSVLALVVSLSACANLSRQDQNTAAGAGIGAVAGSVLTGGSAAGTFGGAVVGGVIGNRVKRN